MAPKSRPRGLKASKGAAPFVPEAAPVDTPSDRTFPADEDALTLSDLFQLRRSALALLTLPDSTAEQQDEARGLLRGILHGCELLHKLLPTNDEDPDDDSDPDLSEEQNPDQARALGLRYRLAASSIPWLQAFALHELSSILPPPEPLSTAAVSSAATGGGAKKRKVDLSEPTSPEEWLDEALDKYAAAEEDMYMDDPSLFVVVFYCDYVRALGERARMHLAKGEGEDVAELVEKMQFNLENQIEAIYDQMQSRGHAFATVKELRTFEAKYGEVWPAFLRAVSVLVSLVDGAEESGRPRERCQHLAEVIDWFEADDKNVSDAHDWVDKEGREKVKVEIAILLADAALAKFMITDDEVEETFRPEAEDVDEEGEEEVVPLPDNEEVREAKTLGEAAIKRLYHTITLFDALPAAEQSPATQLAQYKKLEETLLIFGSLINADDEEGTKKVEAELEKVRKDGGIEEESEE